MGNLVATADVYRQWPLKDTTGVFGGTELYKYGGCRITGWRREQEDKMICLPRFFQDYSFFAVYDGHGGEDAAEYLYLNLHKYIIDALTETDDKELALYLAFLTCDLSLREITQEELSKVRKIREKNVPKLTAIPVRSELQFVPSSTSDLADENNASSTSSCAKENYDNPGSSVLAEENDNKGNDDRPGSSVLAEGSEDRPGSSVLAEGNDDKPGSSVLAEENDNEPGASVSTGESDQIDDLFPRVGIALKNLLANSKTVQHLYSAEDLADEDDDAEDEDYKMEEDMEEESGSSSINSTSNGEDDSDSEVNESDDQSDSSIIDKSQKIETSPLIGSSCGSTATVVIFNGEKVYIANVGDSRCIASINGRASVLSKDHSPEDSLERNRIRKAGCRVTKDGRINYGLNMSRSFGDYGLKMKKTAEPFQAVSCEPDIKAIDITQDLDFIVIASDGIWNVWEDQDVVDFIKGKEGMELEDICAELFEILIPSDLTDDGTGCDNMTVIIIRFGNSKFSPNYLQKQSVVYRYPQELTRHVPIMQKQSKITKTDDPEKCIPGFSTAKKIVENIENQMFAFHSGLPLFDNMVNLATGVRDESAIQQQSKR